MFYGEILGYFEWVWCIVVMQLFCGVVLKTW